MIRKLIDEKGDIGNNYSIDEKEFIQLYSGMGGLEKFGATFEIHSITNPTAFFCLGLNAAVLFVLILFSIASLLLIN